MTPSVSQTQINAALASFLQSILPSSTKVVTGQINRVPEPVVDFVVMWPLRRPRLATNRDSVADAKFSGSIAATVMTVASVQHGLLANGRQVFGAGVAALTAIVNQLTGSPGGAGTYMVTPSQTVAATVLSAGSVVVEQSTEIVMQLDVHGPNSADNVQTISTLFRDDYAVQQFATAPIAIAPLYADDPKQLPFVTAANQFEDRWMIEVHLQVTPAVSIPQQFGGALTLDVTDVETPVASWPNSVVTAP